MNAPVNVNRLNANRPTANRPKVTNRVRGYLAKHSTTVERIPYFTMWVAVAGVMYQFISFWEDRDMTNIPFVSLLVWFGVAALTLLYSIHKKLPLLPPLVTMSMATLMILTKYFVMKERNWVKPV